jgi:hypothetical protein
MIRICSIGSPGRKMCVRPSAGDLKTGVPSDRAKHARPDTILSSLEVRLGDVKSNVRPITSSVFQFRIIDLAAKSV